MARICLIDDDPLIRKSLRRVLENAGHMVATASDGLAGLHLIDQYDFDLVITDIILPGMNGVEIVRRVRERMPTLKLIAMSGGGRDSNTDFLTIAQHMGANEIIHKPVTTQELLATIDRCLGA